MTDPANPSWQQRLLLAAATGPDWVRCTSSTGPNDETDREEVSRNRQAFDRLLLEVLLSENLVMLAGLGTTQCLNTSGAPRIAPLMSDLWDAAVEKADATFPALKAKVGYTTPPEGDDIELLLSQCQLYQALHPDDLVGRFVAEAEALIVSACRFVNQGTDLTIHESFLRKVARRSTRQPRTKLFTTNYDLCFETAASHASFIAVDGFSHTQPQEFDGTYFAYDFVRRDVDREMPDYVANVFQLYKVHGSVDWELRRGQVIRSELPDHPLIIYPRHGKFEASYDQPFIEMMSRFQIALRQRNTGLLVIGCGMRDAHVVQPIMAALRSNVGLKAVVVDPALSSAKTQPVEQMGRLIRSGDSRLALVETTFEDLVATLPELVGGTDEDRHRDRLRDLGARQ